MKRALSIAACRSAAQLNKSPLGRLAIIALMTGAVALSSVPVKAICLGGRDALEYRVVVAPQSGTCYAAEIYARQHFEDNMRGYAEEEQALIDDPLHQKRWDPDLKKEEFAAAARGVIVTGQILRVKARRLGTDRRFRQVHSVAQFGDEGTFHLPEVSDCGTLPPKVEGLVATVCCDTLPARNFLCGSRAPPGFSRLTQLVGRQHSNRLWQAGGKPPAAE